MFTQLLNRLGALKSNGMGKEQESSYGDDSFSEAKVKQSGLLDDITALGPNLGEAALTLLDEVAGKGKPYDDRTFLVGLDLR